MRWVAAACGGLLAALAAGASAQTNASAAVAPVAGAVPAAMPQTNVPPAMPSPPAVSPTNVVSQTAPPPAGTNAVSVLDLIQTDTAFQSYTNLIEHSLFVPTSEIGGGSGSAGDTGPSFAGGLRLTGFFVRGKVIEASLEDRNEPDKKLFVKTGDTIADTEIKVTGFDLRGRAVLLKKGDEEGRLEYESEAAPVAGKPGVPGMPGAPGQPGMPMMQRPGMTPMPPQPGMPAGARTAVASPGAAPTAAAGPTGDANRQALRKQQRAQTITRLQQMLQGTTDPAAKQRLQNYIQMLEKANTQE